MSVARASPSDNGSLIVTAHQPNFLPRLKVLHKISAADVWVVLDDVQYVSREWQSRVRVTPVFGKKEAFWLSVSVHRFAGRHTKLRDVRIVDYVWIAEKIKRSLHHAYRGSRYWPWISSYSDRLLAKFSESLCDTAIASAQICLQMLEVTPTARRSSSHQVLGMPSARLVAICAALNGTTYIAGSGARAYLDMRPFDAAGVRLVWQNWPLVGLPAAVERDACFLDYVASYGPEELQSLLFAARSDVCL